MLCAQANLPVLMKAAHRSDKAIIQFCQCSEEFAQSDRPNGTWRTRKARAPYIVLLCCIKKKGGGGFKNRATGLRGTAIKKQKHDARCGSQKGELSAWVVYFVNVVRLTCWPLIAMLPIFRVTTLLPFWFDFQLEVWKRRWNSQDAFLFLSCTRSECCTADGRVIQKSVFSFFANNLEWMSNELSQQRYNRFPVDNLDKKKGKKKIMYGIKWKISFARERARI